MEEICFAMELSNSIEIGERWEIKTLKKILIIWKLPLCLGKWFLSIQQTIQIKLTRCINFSIGHLLLVIPWPTIFILWNTASAPEPMTPAQLGPCFSFIPLCSHLFLWVGNMQVRFFSRSACQRMSFNHWMWLSVYQRLLHCTFISLWSKNFN